MFFFPYQILSYVEVRLPYVTHTVTLKSSPGVDGTGVAIDNLVDIRANNNQELAMRLETGLRSGEEFFTDLNGFQMIKRRRMKKLPLQANYYPMASMAYIQDEERYRAPLTQPSPTRHKYPFCFIPAG